MHRYRELNIWKDGIQLVKEVYELTKTFPKTEQFGLISQMNRCTVSIPANIAEGAGRNNPKEFNQFLGIALGSAAELDTYLEVCKDLEFISESERRRLSDKLYSLMNRTIKLQQSLKNQSTRTATIT